MFVSLHAAVSFESHFGSVFKICNELIAQFGRKEIVPHGDMFAQAK